MEEREGGTWAEQSASSPGARDDARRRYLEPRAVRRRRIRVANAASYDCKNLVEGEALQKNAAQIGVLRSPSKAQKLFVCQIAVAADDHHERDMDHLAAEYASVCVAVRFARKPPRPIDKLRVSLFEPTGIALYCLPLLEPLEMLSSLASSNSIRQTSLLSSSPLAASAVKSPDNCSSLA